MDRSTSHPLSGTCACVCSYTVGCTGLCVESLSDASSEIGEADEGDMEKSKGSGSKAVQINQEGSLPVVVADPEDMDTEDAFVPASEGEGVSVEDKEVLLQACSVCLQER